jgi:orsellinic acid C2-O-methyltransferase
MSPDNDPPSDDDPALVERFQAMVMDSWRSQALCVAASLGLADLLAGGPMTSADLASATGAHPAALHRFLRALGTIDVCRERDDGRFELTGFGSLLREDASNSQRAWTIWWGRHLWPVWEHLLYSVRTGESARKMLQGTEGFAHLARDPDAAAIFNRAGADQLRLAAAAIVRAYDFGRFERIVDLGGGHGSLLLAILKAHPGPRGVLFDLSHAMEGARRAIEESGLAVRCDLVCGDFFESVPGEADAYILKSVLHDWDRERGLRILRNCRQAMRPTARLLIIEPVVPERFAATAADQAIARSDLTMLIAHAAQERSEAAYRELLGAAGFSVARLLPVGGGFTLIEAFSAR